MNKTKNFEELLREQKNRVNEVNEVRDIQGQEGNWNYDPYMLGLYNGLELASATLENREPIYRSGNDLYASKRLKISTNRCNRCNC